MALVLLVGAALMIQSFLRLRRVDPGFRPENVLAADISLPGSRYKNGPQVSNFQRQLLERIAALPGVSSVGAAAYLPFSGTNNSWTIQIEGRSGDWPEPGWRPVTANYFRTMGTPLVKGRDFAALDDDETAPYAARFRSWIRISRSTTFGRWKRCSPNRSRVRSFNCSY